MPADIFRAIANGVNSGQRAIARCRRAFSLASCPGAVKPNLVNCYRQADRVRRLVEQSCRILSDDVWLLAEAFEGMEDIPYEQCLGLLTLWLSEESDELDPPLLKKEQALARAMMSFSTSYDRLAPEWRMRVSAVLRPEVGYLAACVDRALDQLHAREDREDKYGGDWRP